MPTPENLSCFTDAAWFPLSEQEFKPVSFAARVDYGLQTKPTGAAMLMN